MIAREMPLPSSIAWKLVLVVVLIGGILLSACAHAPRRPLPSFELRRLVLAAVTLYAVGVFASLTHHPLLAGVVYVSGIAACALAAWLSRGIDPEDPPDDGGQEPPR
jgi:heme A synthase